MALPKYLAILLSALVIGGLVAAATADVLATRSQRNRELDAYRENIAELERTISDCKAKPEIREGLVNLGNSLIYIQRKYIELVSSGYKTEQMVNDIQMDLKAQPYVVLGCSGAFNSL